MNHFSFDTLYSYLSVCTTNLNVRILQIDFNWYHLASWVNITEQWPYKFSWVIYVCDRQFSDSDPQEDAAISLKSVYEKIRGTIPTQKDLEPLIELDREEKKLVTFLSYHKRNLSVADLKIFLPFSINLDPYIKKVIKDEIQGMEDMGLTLDQIFGTATLLNPPKSPLIATEAPSAGTCPRQSYT